MKKIIFIFSIIIALSSCDESIKINFKSNCYKAINEKVYFSIPNIEGNKKQILLENANSKNFKIINKNIPKSYIKGNIWAKDSLYVYYREFQIKGADSKSFTILEDGYAKDKNSVYFKENKINNVDLATFKTLSYFYANDKNKIWFCGKEVQGIDSISEFEIIDGYFSRNKNNIFLNKNENLEIKPKIDKNTFVEIEASKEINQIFKNEEDTINTVISDNFKFYKDTNFIYRINTELLIIENKSPQSTVGSLQ